MTSDHTVTLPKGQKVEPNVKCWEERPLLCCAGLCLRQDPLSDPSLLEEDHGLKENLLCLHLLTLFFSSSLS